VTDRALSHFHSQRPEVRPCIAALNNRHAVGQDDRTPTPEGVMRSSAWEHPRTTQSTQPAAPNRLSGMFHVKRAAESGCGEQVRHEPDPKQWSCGWTGSAAPRADGDQ